jgi:CheY-like chemotaxis protein
LLLKPAITGVQWNLEALIKNVALIHWDAPEAAARAARLQTLGYAATSHTRAGPALLRAIRESMPSAVLVDLSRLPGQGRDVAVELRQNRATQTIPIVFVDGLPEKVLMVRQTLPDAVYTTWTHLADDLPRAILRPPRKPIVPAAAAAPAGARSVAAKLGIQPGDGVALLGAPPDFAATLDPLPAGASLHRQMSEACRVVVWFVRSRRELQDNLPLRAARLGQARLWIAWPKKATGQSGTLDGETIRRLASAQGLGGGRPISVDPGWFGLMLTREAGS